MGIFHRLLKISSREAPRLLAVSGIYFVLLVGIGFGRVGRDAVFVRQAGADKLAFMYVLNAVLMVLVSFFYARVVDRLSREFFLNILLAGGALVVGALLLWMPRESAVSPYAFYGVSEVLVLIVPMHFWTFANDRIDPRTGKRIFPLIGGAGLIGTIIGGGLAGYVSRDTGSYGLLYIWIFFFLCAIPAIILFRLRAGPAPREDHEDDEEHSGFLAGIRGVTDIPLIRTLAILAVPMWLTVYMVDYQFYLALDESFPREADMTLVLGLVTGVASGLGLVFQLFFTSRILARFGVGAAVLVYPAAMTVGAAALVGRVFAPPGGGFLRFMPAAFARTVDEAIIYSIGDSAYHLLYNSVPEERRGRARAFISGMMEPAGTAIAGFVLIGISVWSPPDYVLPIMAFVCGLVWLRLSLRVRNHYRDALVDNLSSREIDLRNQALRELGDGFDAAVTERLFAEIKNARDEESALMSLHLLTRDGGAKKERATRRRLLELLPELKSSSVIVATLNALARETENHSPEEALILYAPGVEPFLTHKEGSVRAAAVRTLGKIDVGFSDAHATALETFFSVDDFLKDPAAEVQAEALIVCLRRLHRLDGRNRYVRELRGWMRGKPANRAHVAYVISEAGKHQLIPDLLKLVRSPDESTRARAFRALGNLGDADVAIKLIRLFEDEALMYRAMEAVQEIGHAAVEPLLKALNKPRSEIQALNIILCLGRIGDPSAIPGLARMLSLQSVAREDAALEALSEIRFGLHLSGHSHSMEHFLDDAASQGVKLGLRAITKVIERSSELAARIALSTPPGDRVTAILLDALQRMRERKQEAALRFLEIIGNPAAVRAAAADLRGEERSFAEAVELLEGLGPEAAELARVLEKAHAVEPGDLDALDGPGLESALSELLSIKERPWFYALILYAAGKWKLQGMAPIVTRMRKHDSAFVRRAAVTALARMGHKPAHISNREVNRMKGDMERILFLRSVPLFKEVDGDDLQWINDIARERRFRAGEVIFRENDRGNALYIILSGSVRILKGKAALDMLEERDCFGEMSILDQEPRSATVEASVDARLLVIKSDDFQRLLIARPRISFALFKTLSRRMRDLSGKVARLSSGPEHQERLDHGEDRRTGVERRAVVQRRARR